MFQVSILQFLAISRGEDLKILSQKIEFPQDVESQWQQYCRHRYIGSKAGSNAEYSKIIDHSIQDAYNRIGILCLLDTISFILAERNRSNIFFLSTVEPLFTRRIRSKLTETAHRASIDIFSVNLKSILLTPPMSNTTVLGLDPGKRLKPS